MKTKIACPDCHQDELLRWVLTPTGEEILLCPECDATWLASEEPSSATITRFWTFTAARGLPYDFGQISLPATD